MRQNQTAKCLFLDQNLLKKITSILKITPMKKAFLTLGLIAVLSTTFVSCSADDSAMTETSAEDFTVDNGNKDLPKPPQKP